MNFGIWIEPEKKPYIFLYLYFSFLFVVILSVSLDNGDRFSKNFKGPREFNNVKNGKTRLS